MWVDLFAFILGVPAGSLLRMVCTLVGKMASVQVFVFTLFLVLSVHGSEVGKPVMMSL